MCRRGSASLSHALSRALCSNLRNNNTSEFQRNNMTNPFDPDELLVCPYDPVHRVARKRMQIHLVKCRTNYNTHQYRTCPFNAQHVIPAPELSFHISHCPHRGRVEVEVLHENYRYKQKGNTTIPEQIWTPPEVEESWDDDNVVYEPRRQEELYDTEVASTKVKQTSSVRSAPLPPEEVRMPHSLPLTGGGARGSTSTVNGFGKGRGRGRGITGAVKSGQLQQPGGVSLIKRQEANTAQPRTSSLPVTNNKPGASSGIGCGSTNNHPGASILPPGMGQSKYPGVAHVPPGVRETNPLVPPGLGQPAVPSLPPGLGQPAVPSLPPGLGQPAVPFLPPGLGQPVVPSLPPALGQTNHLGASSLPPGMGQFSYPGVVPLPPGVRETNPLVSPGLGQTNHPEVSSLLSCSGQTSYSLPLPVGLGRGNYLGMPSGLSRNTGYAVNPGLGRGAASIHSMLTGLSQMPETVATANHIANPEADSNASVGMKIAPSGYQATKPDSVPPAGGISSPSLKQKENSPETEEEWEQQRKTKTIRKLRKILRQVEELENKQASGVKLTPEQITKINRKEEIIKQLQITEENII